jgi:hypothetical protein
MIRDYKNWLSFKTKIRIGKLNCGKNRKSLIPKLKINDLEKKTA